MRILVTGAAGFLGGRTATDLARRGHHVVTTDRRGDVAFVGDLADAVFAARLPDVDAVIHAAGVQYISPDLPVFARGPWFYRNNTLATSRLVDRYRQTEAHFVYVSTSMTYAQNGAVCGPGTLRKAQGLYSDSKMRAESYVAAQMLKHASVVPCIIAGDGRGGLFVPFVRSMRRWGLAIVLGAGRNRLSLVHVEDVSSLLATIVERGATGTFNAAASDPVSLLDWVEEIEQTLHLRHVRRISIPYGLVRGLSVGAGYRLLAQEQLLLLNHDHVLSIDASASLGWTPRWSNREIVRETAKALARGS
jgi:nucleoside-diphosphate-sugar epimerase